jgi:hypothetical protein
MGHFVIQLGPIWQAVNLVDHNGKINSAMGGGCRVLIHQKPVGFRFGCHDNHDLIQVGRNRPDASGVGGSGQKAFPFKQGFDAAQTLAGRDKCDPIPHRYGADLPSGLAEANLAGAILDGQGLTQMAQDQTLRRAVRVAG